MSPAVKYTLGRIGLFVAVLLALLPVDLNLFLKLILALAFSAAISFFLLRSWRDQMAVQLASGAAQRRAERERLRAALAGDDEAGDGRGDNAAAGGRRDDNAAAGGRRDDNAAASDRRENDAADEDRPGGADSRMGDTDGGRPV